VIFAFKIWLKVPRTILPFGKDLAAREETAAVRGKHFENCFPLRLSLQKLFKLFLFFFVLFVLFVFKIWLKVPRTATLCLKSDARRAASQKVPRTILPFGKDLAAREETAAVRGKHFENCFPLRLSLQKLFKLFLFFFVLFVLFVFKIWLKVPRTATLCLKSDARRAASQKVPRAILPFGKDLAAREETAAVRGKHFENCFPLRLSLQKLFKPFLFFFVLFVVKIWLKGPRAATLCLKSDARRAASQLIEKRRETRRLPNWLPVMSPRP